MPSPRALPAQSPPADGRFIPALLVGAILFVAANGWAAFRAVKRLESGQHWVDHTRQVIVQVERIMGLARDAEAGSRGFLVTGQPRFLGPYASAESALAVELDAFGQLTADNPTQRERLAQMRVALARSSVLLDQANSMRAAGGTFDTGSAVVLMDAGKDQMDRVRAIADAMEGEERRLLVGRLDETRRAGTSVRIALAAASFLDILLIVFMFRYIVRERSLRVAAETVASDLAVTRTEIERKADEIHQLNQDLEQRVALRTAELEATNRELEAFSYSVSHDLRAPLRTIDGFSLALEEDYAEVVGAEGKDYIQRVRTGVQRMGGLIDALLQLSRITRAEIERRPVDLSALAESVAAQVVEQNPAQKITFTIEPGMNVEADAKLLRVALENLFNNAAKFSSKKPESLIEFAWGVENKAWFVRDNGAGFDMHYKDKLFGAFNRLHGDREFKGSGIGLATVARVIARHHGRIWAESVLNNGATFWFTLG